MIAASSRRVRTARRLLIASNEPVFRAGLSAVVERMGDCFPCVTSAEPRSVMQCLEAQQTFAALVVVDDVPRTLALIARIQSEPRPTPVILVATQGHPDLLPRGLQMGIVGVLVPTSSPCEIGMALSAVETGGVFVSNDAMALLREPVERTELSAPATRALSPRQREVLALVAEGRSTAEIAADLGVSPRTIDSHRLAISRRLGIRNMADLIRYALRHNLVSS